MDTLTLMKRVSYIISLFFLIFGFLFFYNHTHEPIGSLMAAILTASLALISCLMIRWLIQVFLK